MILHTTSLRTKGLNYLHNILRRRYNINVILFVALPLVIGIVGGILLGILLYNKKKKNQKNKGGQENKNVLDKNGTSKSKQKNQAIINNSIYEYADINTDISNITDISKLPNGQYKLLSGITDGNGKIIKKPEQCNRYVGNLTNGIINGYGKFIWANGGSCEGEFKNCQMNGKCKSIFPDGAIYEGEYKDGKRNGRGKMTEVDGSFFEGDWQNGKPHGIGRIKYSNGDIYEGDFRDGKKSGIGKYTKTDGSVSEGEWLDEKPHGVMIKKGKDGSISKGFYENGVLKRKLSESDKYCELLKEQVKKNIDAVNKNSLLLDNDIKIINNRICNNLNNVNTSRKL